MENPLKPVVDYVRAEIDALRYKGDVELAKDNPVLAEIAWTREHFRDLYKIIGGHKRFNGEKGLIAAIKYDALITGFRHVRTD